EECMLVGFGNALHDELAAEAASPACPTARRPGEDDEPPKMWQPLFQALQFRPEDDVLFRSRAIEERRLGIQAKIIYVAEYRHNRRDSAAGCNENNALVLVFVEAEQPERSPRLDAKAH